MCSPGLLPSPLLCRCRSTFQLGSGLKVSGRGTCGQGVRGLLSRLPPSTTTVTSLWAALWSCPGSSGKRRTGQHSEQVGVEGPEQKLRGLAGSPSWFGLMTETGTPKVFKQEECWQWPGAHAPWEEGLVWGSLVPSVKYFCPPPCTWGWIAVLSPWK